MTVSDLLNQCAGYSQEFLDSHIDEMHAAIFGNLDDTEDYRDLMWKSIVNCFQFYCKTSVMLTLTFLIQHDLIRVDPEDKPPLRLL